MIKNYQSKKKNFTMVTESVLNFLVSVRRLPPLSELTGDEERLLFELKALQDAGVDLTVTGVYKLLQGKSGSTAYRNLTGLKEKGLVDVAVDEQDGRRRNIAFTLTAERLFRQFANR